MTDTKTAQHHKTAQHYLAFDLGAESGRGMLARFDGGRISLEEVGRFPTGGEADVDAEGVRRWDVARIGGAMDDLLARAQSQAALEGDGLRGVGVDTWGVDFGLLDAAGELLEPPVQYRDALHPPAARRVLEVLPAEKLWDATGIQPLPFNTLFQLDAVRRRRPDLLDRARHLLLMPSLLSHRLTRGGSLVNEITDASTTQMLDPRTQAWDTILLDRLGLPSHFLGGLAAAGTKLGETESSVPVYAPGTHDTASAVAAAPAVPGTRWAFLSSGTWSLLGAEIAAPVLTHEALHQNFSNEAGVGGTTRLLKNIMGLWLVQECRRSLARTEGRERSYAELTAQAAAAPAGGPLIDAAAQRFLAPPDMAAEVRAACAEAGRAAPEGAGGLIRCCLDSLAHAYRQALTDLEFLLGTRFDVLHIVGGGSQNRLLNQLTADACGIPVVAGPAEATALGNVLGQLVAAGEAADWAEARAIAVRSSEVETYLPR